MDFHLPQLGEGIYEAELVEWKVRPGDSVRPAQSLAEVMTDKATMELPSPFTGTITGLAAEPGSTVKVGQVILSYEGDEVPAGPLPPKARAEAVTAEKAGGTQRKSGAATKSAAPRTDRPASKTAPEIPHEADAQDGPTPGTPRVPAAPSIRRLAANLGIDLTTIRGSGPGGRILIDDLSAGLRESDARSTAAPIEPAAKPARSPIDYGTPGSTVPFLGMRRKTAERMVHSVNTIPHVSYIDECDATELVRLRDALRESFARQGIRLTFLPFFVKAVVEALQQVPYVNSSLDDEQEEIILHDRYDIGIATATPRGLVVPVVRNADKLSLMQIGREIERLSGEARTGQLRRDDLGDSTFTITSIGSIGGLISTPVINHPEVAILGIGRVVKRPVYDAKGNIRPADMVYLSFSFDHRVIDGAVGAAFGNAVIQRLQNPAALLLEPPE